MGVLNSLTDNDVSNNGKLVDSNHSPDPSKAMFEDTNNRITNAIHFAFIDNKCTDRFDETVRPQATFE